METDEKSLGKDYSFIDYLVFPRELSRENLLQFARVKLRHGVNAFYEGARNIENVGYQLHPFYTEVLKNSYDHKNNEEMIIFGTFLTPQAVCFGCYDGGDYFRDQKNVEMWKNKQKIESTKRGITEYNSGIGHGMIYDLSDIIEVDKEKGILYVLREITNNFPLRD